MFNRLLANLPFNPSLVAQISFYGQRMRREASIRRLGFLFVALAFAVQFFAVISPPQASLAASNNDLVNGGFSTPAEAADDCNSNVADFGTILANYGITCAKVASAPTITIHSTDFNRQLFSMGRLPYNLDGETPVEINGAGTVYARYLWGWDKGATPSYKALNVTSQGGQNFFILCSSGDLTSVGTPQPIQKPPVLTSTPSSNPAPNSNSTPDTKAICPFGSGMLQNNPLCVACPFNSNIIQSDAQCKPCSASLSSEDTTACVVFSKTASNLTQNISDANNTTAQVGNVISYTLSAKNTGQATVKNFVIQENISDVLDYANVQDLNGSALNNTLDELSWPGTDIAPGQTISKTFTVKVKNPIPNTPQSTTDPMHFDHMMTNVYGNTVNIKLPQTLGSTVQTAQATLPNTGPGESLFVAGIIVILAGYFWSRSRLLAMEAIIVRNGDVE